MKPYKRVSKGALAIFAAGMIATGGLTLGGMPAFAETSTNATPSTLTTTTPDVTGRGLKHRMRKSVVLPTGGISEAQARAAILAQFPSVTIKHIRLGNEGGVVAYEAHLSDKSEVIVDVMTSAVRKETDAEEALEHSHKGKSGNQHRMMRHMKSGEKNAMLAPLGISVAR